MHIIVRGRVAIVLFSRELGDFVLVFIAIGAIRVRFMLRWTLFYTGQNDVIQDY